MFGYVVPDKPNMFMKDYTMYRAYYCGICKSTGKRYGQLMRFATSYDITFMSLLLHGVHKTCPKFSEEGCILNPKKKTTAKDDELTRLAVDISVMLVWHKLRDNIADDGGIFKRIADKLFIRRKYKKASRVQPEIDLVMKNAFEETFRLEKAGEDSVDRIAHPFAEMMKGISEIAFKEHYSEALGDFMYNLGRWIYIMDAIDDIDEDYKSKSYNPFLFGYEYKDKQTFLEEKSGDLRLLLMSAVNRMADDYKQINTTVTEGPVTNIVWYGLLERTESALTRSDEKWKKIRI